MTASVSPVSTPARRWLRLLAGIAATVLASAGLVAADLSPRAAYAAACSGTTGVTVVVDFTELGGDIEVECASGDPDSGLEALSDAGFSYAFVPGIPGFVCQINNLPDPCNGAPPEAYWSYWEGEDDGSWSYASSGAGSHDPAPGDAEGWAFGAGDPPGITAP